MVSTEVWRKLFSLTDNAITTTTANKSIEIAVSPLKLTKLLLCSVHFFGAGLWMIDTNPQISHSLFNNPVVKAIASYGSTIMGLLGILFFSRKLFHNRPAFMIDDLRIAANTSVFNFGLIPWSDIAQIYDRTIQVSIASKKCFVTVGLFHPDTFISREKNPLKRKLLSVNAKCYGSPIHIPAGKPVDEGRSIPVCQLLLITAHM